MNGNETKYIYGLICPIELKVKYIGQSIDPIRRRMDMLCDSPKRYAKTYWIRALMSVGLKPILYIFTTCNSKDALKIELDHILKYKPRYNREIQKLCAWYDKEKYLKEKEYTDNLINKYLQLS